MSHTVAYPTPLPGYTSAPLPSHSLSTQCCCISLSSTDKMRLICMPEQLVDPIRQTIMKSWGSIQRETNIGARRDQEFKLWGNPWSGTGIEAVKARRLICQIMKTMAERGWNLIQAADISKHEHDKDSMFFESQVNGVLDHHVEMFAVSFNRTDCIRIIDAPQMIPLIRATIKSHWRQGIQSDGDYAGSHQFQLSGNPFFSSGYEAVDCRALLCNIISTFRNQGFKLYSSIDCSTGRDGRDLESWVFRRVGPSWS